MSNFTKVSNTNKYVLSNLDVKLDGIESFLAVDSKGNIVDAIPISENRNNVYRGKNLTGIYTIEQLYTKVINGDFTDLYIGDYIIVGKFKLAIAGFNIYCKTGPTDIGNHIVFIVESGIENSYMNPTNTSAGGYFGSYMYKTYLPKIYNELNPLVGRHIITHKELLSNSIDTNVNSGGYAGWKGASNGWDWYNVNLMLCSEIEVYGSTVFSSSGYDIGIAKTQLPYFRLNEKNINIRSNWWLSTVHYAIGFCYCGWGGYANCHLASSVLSVRPRFLFGKQS